MPLPTVQSFLPDLLPFIRTLASDFEAGTFTSWADARERVFAFFTPERMAQVEAVVPGWVEMASYENGQTLIHVPLVMVGLLLQPEYQAAPPDQQRLAEWIVLFHDVAKQAKRGAHDWTHGFRSAGMAARALPRLGFPRLDRDDGNLEAWIALTCSAMTPHPTTGEVMHDNRQLPSIIDGMHDLFGEGTAATTILKTVLFHMSLDFVRDYPTAAPLTDDEAMRYIDPPTRLPLKMMALADSDGWGLFDPAVRQEQREDTLEKFRQLDALFAAQQT